MTSVLAEPIPVEFPYAGGWYPGVLLGWRHDGAHDCRIRVRCVVGGLRRTTWMTLADLRLPDPAASAVGRAPRPTPPPCFGPATGPSPPPDPVPARPHGARQSGGSPVGPAPVRL